MSDPKVHENHLHAHGTGCGHVQIEHRGHQDYLHDGHLHHVRGDRVEDHVLEVSKSHPAACTPAHACDGHPKEHVHGTSCGHPAVPHGDHVDYVVKGHLHHPCTGHCDHHGAVSAV